MTGLNKEKEKMQAILVTTTCDKKEVAGTIAKAVLENRLAACVQVLGPVESSYWWNHSICVDREYLIQMKSEKNLFSPLARLIKSLHTYEIPEIIATELCNVDDDYLAWMKQELSFQTR